MEPKSARAFLERVKGFEEATAIMENRYIYAYYAGEAYSGLKADWLEMRKMLAIVRRDTFRALLAIQDEDSRRVLWQLYIERKEKGEVAEFLHMTLGEVEKHMYKGFYELELPQDKKKWTVIE